MVVVLCEIVCSEGFADLWYWKRVSYSWNIWVRGESLLSNLSWSSVNIFWWVKTENLKEEFLWSIGGNFYCQEKFEDTCPLWFIQGIGSEENSGGIYVFEAKNQGVYIEGWEVYEEITVSRKQLIDTVQNFLFYGMQITAWTASVSNHHRCAAYSPVNIQEIFDRAETWRIRIAQ